MKKENKKPINVRHIQLTLAFKEVGNKRNIRNGNGLLAIGVNRVSSKRHRGEPPRLHRLSNDTDIKARGLAVKIDKDDVEAFSARINAVRQLLNRTHKDHIIVIHTNDEKLQRLFNDGTLQADPALSERNITVKEIDEIERDDDDKRLPIDAAINFLRQKVNSIKKPASNTRDCRPKPRCY
jgi:hypothetical protein